MHRRKPLGLDGEPPPPDDIAPYAGCHIPGPITTFTAKNDIGAIASPSPSSTRPDNGAAIRPFPVGGRLYRLRRLDTTWQCLPNEERMAPDAALAILEHALGEHQTSVRLVRLLDAAVKNLAGLHEGGIYVLLWLQDDARFEGAPAAVPAPKRAAPLIRPPDPPPVEEPMMPVAQARALKNAAKQGVPFCEECERAKAQRAAQTA